jgi:hypothetical protein
MIQSMRGRLAVALGVMAFAAPATAVADTPLGDPSANREPNPATIGTCAGDANAAPCLTLATNDIDAARALEGVGPISLPTNWTSLSVPIQLLVIANLERVDRGLIPVTGLSSALNALAQQGADTDADPPFPNPFHGTWGTGNWAGGYSSPLEANFGWMYDDGVGSPNLDCHVASDTGCWGHRHSVLLTDAPAYTSVVMGAALATNTQSSPSMTQEFIADDPDHSADVTPLWSTITAALPVGVSANSLTVPSGSSKPLIVWASGENMTVAASISSGWSINPAGCPLAAGHSCTLTVSNAGGSTGTLTLTGPNGNQTVALASQTVTSTALTSSAATIVAGKKASLNGKVVTASGAGVGGQSVTLTTHPAGSAATTLTGHTSANGTVSFNVAPRTNTSYSLSFAGTTEFAASASSSASVTVAPKITVSLKRGRHLRVGGRVSPPLPGTRIKLQRKRGRGWRTVATAKLGRSGAFTFPVKLGIRYRVLTPATATNTPGTSATFATVA